MTPQPREQWAIQEATIQPLAEDIAALAELMEPGDVVAAALHLLVGRYMNDPEIGPTMLALHRIWTNDMLTVRDLRTLRDKDTPI